MKAWLLPAKTGLPSLTLADIPTPTPAPGEVLLKLHYAALNPADAYLAQGQYPAKPSFPHILGRDGLGTVVTYRAPDGPRAPDGNPGHPRQPSPPALLTPGTKLALLRSEVGVNRPGTFAEFVTVPAESLIPVPPGWTDQQTAGAPLVYLTAYQALTQWGQLPAPCVTLITGASGGVGVASIYLAKALEGGGHTVIALSRSPQKSQTLRSLPGGGADITFDPSQPTWPKLCRDWLDTTLGKNRRVDLAIDNLGGPTLPEVIDTLAMHGRVSIVGRLAGPTPNFNSASLFFRRLRLGGVAVGTYTNEESHAAWTHILSLLEKTGARPLVDSIHPFTQLPAAFTRLAQGPLGKVLLQIP